MDVQQQQGQARAGQQQEDITPGGGSGSEHDVPDRGESGALSKASSAARARWEELHQGLGQACMHVLMFEQC